MKKRLKIGLFGYGVVGQGLYDVLQSTPAFDASIDKIVVKNKKERNLPESMFYYNPDEILDDPDINVVVEVIDNAEDAYHIVKKALQKGKNVVSANKKMLAEHMSEMIELQKDNHV
jgi:homoserine dehydrogenase